MYHSYGPGLCYELQKSHQFLYGQDKSGKKEEGPVQLISNTGGGQTELSSEALVI